MQLQHLAAASALVAMPLGLVWLSLAPTRPVSEASLLADGAEEARIESSLGLDPRFLRSLAPSRECHGFAPSHGPLDKLWSTLRASLATELARGDAAVPAGALVEACCHDQPHLVRGLLAAGADANERDEDGCPALLLAALNGSSAIVAMLLAAGADPHASLEDRTQAIHLAASFGVAESLRLLLAAGVSVDARDDQECTPLWCAASEGNLETLEFLLASGAQIDARDLDGSTPLHRAYHSGVPAIVRTLCAAGAELEARDNRGRTPLLVAVSLGSVEMVETLLDLGADLHTVDHERQSALHVAVASSRPEIVRLLLARGIDRHGKNARGESAIEFGLGEANLETMQALWGDEPAPHAAPRPDLLEMQRFALVELEALAEKREHAELRVHGFDPAFLEPDAHGTFARLRIEGAPPSHEHCSETRCTSEPGERWQLSTLAEQESGSWQLDLHRNWNFCPRDTRPRGGMCGNGSTLTYELVPHDGQWYFARTDVGGDHRIRRLPQR
ncbi:MAG: ankyrin repeat domain-containing protein [Planctomycetes bacterium]|nr:ankyrin repeat domain-containing protein [Planctomycetota bacterium]